MFFVSPCCCLCPIHWSHVFSWEWRCSWSSADRRCSNYIWVINNFIAYWGASYIRDFTVGCNQSFLSKAAALIPNLLLSDAMTWKWIRLYWPTVRGIHRCIPFTQSQWYKRLCFLVISRIPLKKDNYGISKQTPIPHINLFHAGTVKQQIGPWIVNMQGHYSPRKHSLGIGIPIINMSWSSDRHRFRMRIHNP